jgi:hypothetical protein
MCSPVRPSSALMALHRLAMTAAVHRAARGPMRTVPLQIVFAPWRHPQHAEAGAATRGAAYTLPVRRRAATLGAMQRRCTGRVTAI